MNSSEIQHPPVIIGIGGGSGSGKTTVALKVRDRFPRKTVEIIHHDSYYLDRPDLSSQERHRINYDHPAAFETSLLVQHLAMLRAGKPIDIPVYDFTTQRRSDQVEQILPADILFVEGILVLESPELRGQMDIRLYVDVEDDERFIRRLQRDITERGRDMTSVIRQYRETVKPMHLQFVEPSKRYAQLIIPEGGHNTVAIDMICAKVQDILLQRGRAEAGYQGAME